MKLNQREALLLGALSAAVVLMVGYLWLLTPQIKSLQCHSTDQKATHEEVEALASKKQEFTQTLSHYKIKSQQNKEKISFTFEEQDLEKRMKGFMQVLTHLANTTGNDLITIQPYDANAVGQLRQRHRQDTAEENVVNQDVPEALQRFKAVKEPDLPLYSTEMEMKIRGSFPQIKNFIEALTSYDKELVKIETLYLSYEALDERSMAEFEDSSLKSNPSNPNRHLSKPLLLITRLKFYLMEPTDNAFSKALAEAQVKAQADEEEALEASKKSKKKKKKKKKRQEND
jgi:hypothetical protein